MATVPAALADTQSIYRGSSAVGTCPLFIVGLHSAPQHVEDVAQWMEYADQYGFAVVFMNWGGASPNDFPAHGQERAWLVGNNSSTSNTPVNITANGGGTVKSLGILRWANLLNADPKKVCGVGWSATGSFWQRYVWYNATDPSTFSILAVAPFSETINQTSDGTVPARTTPIAWFLCLGTGNDVIPWNGGSPGTSSSTFMSAQACTEAVARINGWNGVSSATQRTPFSPYIKEFKYTSAQADTRYWLVTAGNTPIAPWKFNAQGSYVTGEPTSSDGSTGGGSHYWPNTRNVVQNNAVGGPGDHVWEAADEVAKWFINTVLASAPTATFFPKTGGGRAGMRTGASKSVTAGTSLLPSRIAPDPIVVAANRTVYVNPVTGDDTRTMATANNVNTPWKSVQHALDSGLTIPGANTPSMIVLDDPNASITDDGPSSTCSAQYQDTAIYQPARDLPFPATSPLIITNKPGVRVLIGFPMKHSKLDSYICWRGQNVGGKKGLVFDTRFPSGNTAFNGFASVGAKHVEVYNAEIRNNVWNSTGGGVYIGEFGGAGPSDDVQLINCFIHHNGGQNNGSHGIYDGGTATSTSAGSINGGIYNCIIAWNFVDNLAPHNAPQGRVYAHNIIAGWGGGGASGGTATTPVTGGTNFDSGFTDGVTVFAPASNTSPMTQDCIWVNNILANNKVYGLNFFDSSLSGTGNVERSNIYFGNGTGAIRDASNTLSKLSTLTNNNPLFVAYSATSPTATDFHLQATSPAKGAANPSYVPSFDFDGNPRTSNDIGPFQIVLTGVTTFIPKTGGGIITSHPGGTAGAYNPNWTSIYGSTSVYEGIFNRSGQGTDPATPTRYTWAYFNPTTFNADQEAWCTITAVGSDVVRIGARVKFPGTSSFSGYFVSISATGLWSIIRVDNGGAPVTLVTGPSAPLQIGDGIGIQVAGNIIRAWYNGGGEFVQLISYDISNDTTKYLTGGSLAVEFNTYQIDDFGGGNSVLINYIQKSGGVRGPMFVGGAKGVAGSGKTGGGKSSLVAGTSALFYQKTGGAKAAVKTGATRRTSYIETGGVKGQVIPGAHRPVVYSMTGGGVSSAVTGAIKSAFSPKTGGGKVVSKAGATQVIAFTKTGGLKSTLTAGGPKTVTVRKSGGPISVLHASGSRFHYAGKTAGLRSIVKGGGTYGRAFVKIGGLRSSVVSGANKRVTATKIAGAISNFAGGGAYSKNLTRTGGATTAGVAGAFRGNLIVKTGGPIQRGKPGAAKWVTAAKIGGGILGTRAGGGRQNVKPKTGGAASKPLAGADKAWGASKTAGAISDINPGASKSISLAKTAGIRLSQVIGGATRTNFQPRTGGAKINSVAGTGAVRFFARTGGAATSVIAGTPTAHFAYDKTGGAVIENNPGGTWVITIEPFVFNPEPGAFVEVITTPTLLKATIGK